MVTALLTAALLVGPWLSGSGAPTVLRAEVTHVAVRPHRTLNVFLNANPEPMARFLAGAKAEGVSDAELHEVLGTNGLIVEYTLELEGAPGRTAELTRTVFNASTEARVPPAAVQVMTPRYVAKAALYRSTQTTWIETPRSPGRYFVEVDLNNPRGETLAAGRSAVFSVR